MVWASSENSGSEVARAVSLLSRESSRLSSLQGEADRKTFSSSEGESDPGRFGFVSQKPDLNQLDSGASPASARTDRPEFLVDSFSIQYFEFVRTAEEVVSGRLKRGRDSSFRKNQIGAPSCNPDRETLT